MRREAVAGVALLIALASIPAVAFPGPTSTSFVAHAPIVIRSDAEFTAANGVTAGSGTPADPFVIAGWHIQTSTGVAIAINNTTAAFVIRENVLEGSTGLRLNDSTGAQLIQNNRFIVRASGAVIVRADPVIRDNAFLAPGGYVSTGVSLQYSNGVVHGNSFDSIANAIVSVAGSVNVTWNDIHRANVGIHLHMETRANVENNTITVSAGTGIYLKTSVHVSLHSNIVWHANVGVRLQYMKDVDMVNNTIRYSTGVGVNVQASSGNITANVVIDGGSDAVQLWGSVMVMVSNRIENNIGIGIVSGGGACDIEANIIINNHIGISVTATILDPPHLRANVLINNTIGLDIPYAARQTIFWMEGNLVNGVNVDGTIVASEKVFFYHAANVTISGGVRDSGFSAGFYGSISAQGNVVLYEVDTAKISGTVISHADIGVYAVNSFNVQVESSLIAQATVGVRAEAVVTGQQVPPCVVSIKDTNITIPVDPPQTIGIDLRGCLGIVARTNVSVVDVGIKIDGASSATLTNVTVTNTRVGLDVVGRANAVTISGAVIENNTLGARFTGTVGVVADSAFRSNFEAGVRLDGGAQLQFLRNNVSFNGIGLADSRACLGTSTCASVAFEGNTFFANRGDGARVNGTTSFRGDAFIANRGDGAEVMATVARDVRAIANDGNGLTSSGRFTIIGSRFDGNGANGVSLNGEGELRDSAFVNNTAAGIRVSATYVTALRLNVSHNFDGILFDEIGGSPGVPGNPTLSLPYLVGLVAGDGLGSGPLDIHLSKLVGNERDAIRAGLAIVNATHNWWGTPDGPKVSALDTVGAFQNGVSPAVRFAPYWTDESMTTTGPIVLL